MYPQGSGLANCVLIGHQEYYTPPAKAGLHPRRARSRRAQLLLCARNRAPTQEPSLHCPAGPASSQPAVCPGDRRAQMGRTQSSEAWTCSPLTPQEGNKGRRHNHRNERICLIFPPLGNHKFDLYVCESVSAL